ncbi:hypothetical protein PoB_005787200 [Plakobranchus ocellatus]|uniref:Uncharacterized protein n=1 Tax=Plakobranchus ocellatus TaxID=259542 RepID=A0AAV4CJ17_9GAST|nr:hypothetical protein PoB_005787200 [Plakobranchus ocellatus]
MFSRKVDNRIKPLPQEGGSNPFTISDGDDVGGGGSKRPPAPISIGIKPTSTAKQQRVTKGVKAIKGFFTRPVRERNMAVIRDIEQTTAEIWLTFAFTVLVGSFFLGGGIYLIWLGSKNNVVDFVVVGGMGALMGFCFTAVGMFLFCKPLCLSHRKRKAERREAKAQVKQESLYISKAKARLLTLQVADTLTKRRPSHVELYGDEKEGSPSRRGKTGSRAQSASSTRTNYDPPPPIALPRKTKEGEQGGRAAPVILFRESTADDRAAIANAAERRNLVNQGQTTANMLGDDKENGEANILLTDPKHDAERGSKPPLSRKLQSKNRDHRPDQLDTEINLPPEVGSLAELLEDLPDSQETNNSVESPSDRAVTQRTNVGSAGTTKDDLDPGELEEAAEDFSNRRRRRVLSAENERRKSVASHDRDMDEEDSIVVVPD